MEYVIGVILIISFIGIAVYCIRGGNLMMGMLIMAGLWTLLVIIGKLAVTNPAFIAENEVATSKTVPEILDQVFTSGPVGWGVVLVNVCFGAFFGRVMLDTGIVSTLIRKTVELSGDKPAITVVLLSIVAAACFTTMTGPGAVISIAIIILPIFLSLGIPKKVALFAYMFSIQAGFVLNPVIFSQYVAYFKDTKGNLDYTYDQNLRFAIHTLLVIIICTMLVTVYLIQKNRKKTKNWATKIPNEGVVTPEAPANAPGYALFTPIVPVLLVIIFKLPIIFAILLASLYALVCCGKMKTFPDAVRSFSKAFHDGVVDSAPIMGFFLTVPMFCQAALLCAPYFKALLGPIVPTAALPLCIIFMVLAPLGMFRGPFTIMGAGAVTVAILQGLGFSTVLLFPLLATTTLIMNCCACPTQSWISWGLGYTKTPLNEYLKLSIPCGWIISIINIAIVYFTAGINL